VDPPIPLRSPLLSDRAVTVADTEEGRGAGNASAVGGCVDARGWKGRGKGRRLRREPPREGGMSLPGRRLDLGRRLWG
jgi:hypothetical protein